MDRPGARADVTDAVASLALIAQILFDALLDSLQRNIALWFFPLKHLNGWARKKKSIRLLPRGSAIPCQSPCGFICSGVIMDRA